MATGTATANRERAKRILAAMPPWPDAAIPAPYTATVPLRVDPESGQVRVGDTRVSVDMVIYEHKRGVSPRTIVRNFTTLTLPDVYAVIAYYLQHREEVDAYLQAWNAYEEAVLEVIAAENDAWDSEHGSMRERIHAWAKAMGLR